MDNLHSIAGIRKRDKVKIKDVRKMWNEKIVIKTYFTVVILL